MTYDERQDALLAEAARVFADKGFHPTTMRDLSRATGMSLAGIYYYVQNKEDLLFRIQERCFTEVLAGARKVLATEGGLPDERLERFIMHHVEFFAAHMAEMKVLSHEAESLSGEAMDRINRLKRDYGELLHTLMQAVRGGENPVDPRVATYALFGMMNWMYTWYDPSGPVSPQDLAAQFATIFLRGIGTPSTVPGRT
jgi:AcrR family transcriptional regulator